MPHIYRSEINITFIVNEKTDLAFKKWSGSSEQALMVETLTTLKPFCLFGHSINPLPQFPFLSRWISQSSSVIPLISNKHKELVYLSHLRKQYRDPGGILEI